MGRVRFSPKALAGFIFFLLAFGLLISIDRAPVPISQAWPILILVFVVGGTALGMRGRRNRGRATKGGPYRPQS
jgi:hypothetical protein